MSAKNGARMMIENSVELSAMTLTPMMFMSANTAMIAQQMT